MLKAHSRLLEHLALAGDLCLIAACWVSAYAIRFHLLRVTDVPPFRDYALQLVPVLIVWGFAFHAFDLYRPSRLGSHLSEWFDVAKASTLGVLVLVAIMTFAFRGYDYSRLVIAFFLVQSVVVVSLARAAFREGLRFARRRGYNQRYAIVVGGGEPAVEVLRVLRRRPDVGIRVLGLLSDKAETPGVDAPRLGGLEDIRAVLDRQQVDIVFIALPHSEYPRLTSVLNEIGDDPVAIHFVPDVFGLASLRGGVEEFESIPFVHLRESPLYGWNRVAKRVDAERETGPVWARPDDSRRTRLGAFLRRWSLDELPQLWNVLRGEMSLVGPRPERPSFVEEFRRRVPGYMLRHKVKAGITGWAQIHGWRGNTSIEKRIEYDLYYIERWSLRFDLSILLQTLWLGFRNRNAY